MSLKNFVAALFPSTESSRLRTLLENSYTSIEKSILPSLQYDDSAVAKTGLYITVDRNLKGTFGPDGYKGDLVKYLRNTMVFMLKERSKVLDIYEKSFSKTIETAALDYKKAYLMEYVAGVVFFADYVSKLSYALTSIAVNDNYKKQGIEDEYVQECTDVSHMRIFATMCNVLNTKTSAFGEALDAMKDISFDVRTDETMQKAYGGKLNPMKMGYMPVVSDIAIIFGEAYNYVYKAIFDYHKDRYEASKMNILYLERKKAGASAEELAAIEKQLTYYRAQLQKHEERMEAMKMALKTDKLIHSRIDKLHQKVCLDSTKPLMLEDCMEFVKLRPAILATTFERDAEFSIFSLLVDRSVGKPVMYTPRVFLDYDLTNLSPSARQEKMNALGKTLTQVESYYKDFSFFTGYLDKLLPANTQEDIYFGIEALWCLVALHYNLHVSKDHGGPAQDGTLFTGRRYFGDDKELQEANY